MEKIYTKQSKETLQPLYVGFRSIDGRVSQKMPIRNLEESLSEINLNGETIYLDITPEGPDRGYEDRYEKTGVTVVGIGEPPDPSFLTPIMNFLHDPDPTRPKPYRRYRVRVKILEVTYSNEETLSWEEFIRYNRPKKIEREVSTTTTLRF